jgi:predicted glycosyltransferase
MDDPVHLSEEWKRKGAVPALNDLYDHIWVYGLPQICDPLEGVPLPGAVTAKMRYTGYLRRTCGSPGSPAAVPAAVSGDPYLLVTTGGGGDGAALIDWVLRAYEHDRKIPHRALLVLGPFMHSALQGEFMERVNRLEKVDAITFDANVEGLMVGATGIVAMGGYNTFCEILSFDKPGLIVPRTEPRVEQYIRASRAQDLGLARMLAADGERHPRRMAAALRELPHQPKPSEVRIAGLLDGLSVIAGMVDQWLAPSSDAQVRLSLVSQGQ